MLACRIITNQLMVLGSKEIITWNHSAQKPQNHYSKLSCPLYLLQNSCPLSCPSLNPFESTAAHMCCSKNERTDRCSAYHRFFFNRLHFFAVNKNKKYNKNDKKAKKTDKLIRILEISAKIRKNGSLQHIYVLQRSVLNMICSKYDCFFQSIAFFLLLDVQSDCYKNKKIE